MTVVDVHVDDVYEEDAWSIAVWQARADGPKATELLAPNHFQTVEVLPLVPASLFAR